MSLYIRDAVISGSNASVRIVAKIILELDRLEGNKTAEVTFFELLESEIKKLRKAQLTKH